MTSFSTSESVAAEALLDANLSDLEGEDASPDDGEVLRLARIEEFQQDSLRVDDPLESSLEGVAGGLLKLALVYEQNITKLLELTGGAIYDSPELQRLMSTYLNILRQLDRIVNLAARLAENRQRLANFKSQRRQAIVPGSVTGPRPRNKR